MVWSGDQQRTARLPRKDAAVDAADSALVAAAQADPTAFTALYERYVDRIYGYCYCRLGDREAAEDATSEVFLKALGALNRYEDLLFAAWLFRIAHNVVLDLQRRRRPTTSLATIEQADPLRGPDDVAIAQAEWATVQAALAALPPAERAAVELPHAGWSSEEIATRLGRSTTAVKQLRYRGMRRLRTILTCSAEAPRENDDG